jgi:hypothetical protein
VVVKKGTGMLINIAISGDRNVIQKEAEKILQRNSKAQKSRI